MSLDNYNDLSVLGSSTSAGFQFEFYCAHCTQRWKSPYKPFRVGQINGILSALAYYFDGARKMSHHASRAGDWRTNSARSSALEEAQEMAERLYTVCSSCHKAVCEDCFDTRDQVCNHCLGGSGSHGHAHGNGYSDNSDNSAGHGQAAGRGGPACPNCGTANGGGRFCAECGFDMASTHKSCPGCGAMAERGARFCGDCGHGF